MRAVGTNPWRYPVCLLCLLALPVLAEDPPADGPFAESECVSCHLEKTPELVRKWRASPHGPESAVGCSGCHGDRHKGSASAARRDGTCAACHEGPANHSYVTSKHGVINTLEAGRQDWRNPLKAGNYRSPGCSYCHLHDGDHGDTMAPQRGAALRQWICVGCHSPRYVREQLANGLRQLEIADLKLAEGEALIAISEGEASGLLSSMRDRLTHHRRNILYGVGHQSPDYQWWHGQPALDGDLIRIRDAVAPIARDQEVGADLATFGGAPR